jgi:hypothetical protein
VNRADELIGRASAPLLFAAAGAGLLIAQGLLPAYPAATAGQVAVAAAHRGAETGAVVAFLVAGALLVLGVAASSGLALRRGRALTRVGVVLTAVGALWPIAGRAGFTATLVAVTGGDRTSAVSAIHAVSNSGAFALFLPLLAAFVVGPILLALGLRRAGALPVWPALLWFAGVLIVNGAEDSSRVVATLGMAAVAVALAWIGRGVGALSASVPANTETSTDDFRQGASSLA